MSFFKRTTWCLEVTCSQRWGRLSPAPALPPTQQPRPDAEISFLDSPAKGRSERAMPRARSDAQAAEMVCVQVCGLVPLGVDWGGRAVSGVAIVAHSPAQTRTPASEPRPEGLSPFPSARRSAAVHKGLQDAQSSAFPLPFPPRCAVPAAPCWPP